MGLKGIHTHTDEKGKTLYMAGPNHEAFMKRHDQILKMKKEEEDKKKASESMDMEMKKSDDQAKAEMAKAPKEKAEAMEKMEDMEKVFMSHCASVDKDLVDTSGMDKEETYSACAMRYNRMKADLEEDGENGLTEKQKKLPKALQEAILKKKDK